MKLGAGPERKTEGEDSEQLRALIFPPCGFPHKVRATKSKRLAQGHKDIYWQSWNYKSNSSLYPGDISLQRAFVGEKIIKKKKKLLSLIYFWLLTDESISTLTLLCSTCFSSTCMKKKKASLSHLHVTQIGRKTANMVNDRTMIKKMLMSKSNEPKLTR